MIWTFRSENIFLPVNLRRGSPNGWNFSRARGEAAAEYELFSRPRVDGVFTDFLEDAAAARKASRR